MYVYDTEKDVGPWRRTNGANGRGRTGEGGGGEKLLRRHSCMRTLKKAKEVMQCQVRRSSLDLSTQEAETDGCPRVQGQPGVANETTSLKNNKKNHYRALMEIKTLHLHQT